MSVISTCTTAFEITQYSMYVPLSCTLPAGCVDAWGRRQEDIGTGQSGHDRVRPVRRATPRLAWPPSFGKSPNRLCFLLRSKQSLLFLSLEFHVLAITQFYERKYWINVQSLISLWWFGSDLRFICMLFLRHETGSWFSRQRRWCGNPTKKKFEARRAAVESIFLWGESAEKNPKQKRLSNESINFLTRPVW